MPPKDIQIQESLKKKFIENNRWPTKILMLTIDNQQSTVDRSKDHS